MIDLPFHRGGLSPPILYSSHRYVAAALLASRRQSSFCSYRGDSDSGLSVSYRPHNLDVSLIRQVPAFLDEEYPIVIKITNDDDRALDVILDILLQPSEIDEAGTQSVYRCRPIRLTCNTVNNIRVDDEHSQNLIKGINVGTIAPGATTLKTLYLTSTGGVGDRVLDISIQSRSPVARDTSEVLRTLSVPTVAPMSVEYGVKYMHTPRSLPGVTDLHTYEGDYWDDGEGGEAHVKARMTCMGPWGLSVETVRLARKVRPLSLVMVCCGHLTALRRMGLTPKYWNALWMKTKMTLLPVIIQVTMASSALLMALRLAPWRRVRRRVPHWPFTRRRT